MKEKLIIDIFFVLLNNTFVFLGWKRKHFLRYYLVALSIRVYNFNKTKSIESKVIEVHFHQFYALKSELHKI